MKKRSVSFAVIFVVYALAVAVGIIVYNALSFSPWVNLLLADVVATIFVFAISVILKNASVYDPYWSVQPIVIIGYLAILKPLNFSRFIVLLVILYWGIRLTANWAYTFMGLDHQDWRYTMLKEKTGKIYPLINLLGIHMFPTLVVYFCVLPAVYVFLFEIGFNAFSFLGFALSITATTIQLFADIEMQGFRKKIHQGFIRTGLWKYSRHPNYLGEILMWWGVAVMLIFALPSMWYLAFGALLNTLMFLFVSIPMAEKRQSKKEGYFEYKAQTRMLLPVKR